MTRFRLSTTGEVREAIEDTLNALGFRQAAGGGKAGRWQLACEPMGQEGGAAGLPYQGHGTAGRRPPAGGGWWDKVDSKFAGWGDNQWKEAGFRAVPNCVVRRSAYIAPGVVLMPSFVNIGAYVDSGTMVDTWATVGSCAQIGKNVHLSGGVGIGGVLEPMQAGPTIIEDNCFIGARSEVVEGCIVREGSVLGMGVFIGQSTKIVDRETGEVMYGEVPAGSVVVAGSMPSKNNVNLYCAVIVKRVDERTRSKDLDQRAVARLTRCCEAWNRRDAACPDGGSAGD